LNAFAVHDESRIVVQTVQLHIKLNVFGLRLKLHDLDDFID